MNIEWNYENNNYMFLNYEEKMDILRKYYPIGMDVDFIEETKKAIEYNNYNWKAGKITDHDIVNYVSVFIKVEGISIYPGHVKPSVKHIRNEKLKQLGI